MKKSLLCILAVCAMAFSAFSTQAAASPESHPQFIAATAVNQVGTMPAMSVHLVAAPYFRDTAAVIAVKALGLSSCSPAPTVADAIEQTCAATAFDPIDPGRSDSAHQA